MCCGHRAVGVSQNTREGPWSGGSTRYIWKFNGTMHSLTFWTSLNDLDCLHAQWQLCCHQATIATLTHTYHYHLSPINAHHPTSSQCHLSTWLSQLRYQATPNAIFKIVKCMGSTGHRTSAKLPACMCTVKDLVNPGNRKAGLNFAGEKVLFCHPDILPLV